MIAGYRAYRLIATPLALSFVAALVGCNSALVGTWKADEAAKPESFAIQSVTFKEDHTYEASARMGEHVTRLAGTYDFNGFNLKLKSPGKPERKYGATLVMGRDLEIRSGADKQNLKKQ